MSCQRCIELEGQVALLARNIARMQVPPACFSETGDGNTIGARCVMTETTAVRVARNEKNFEIYRLKLALRDYSRSLHVQRQLYGKLERENDVLRALAEQEAR